MKQDPDRSILVAEDTRTVMAFIRKALEAANYSVIPAEDGLKAWELYLEHRPRMLLVDWLMPGLDGLSLCRKIRGAPGDDFTYLIMLTSRDRKEDMIEGLDSGADDYVIKPFDMDVLQSRIRVGWRIVDLERNLAEKVTALECSLTQVKQLSGLLPICSYCKKVRRDKGYWEQVEVYIADRTEAEFSHGICPRCYEKEAMRELEELRAERRLSGGGS